MPIKKTKSVPKKVVKEAKAPQQPQITGQMMALIESQVQNGDISLAEAVKLFGFRIGDDSGYQKNKSFALPSNDDGALVLQSGSVYGTYVDLEGTAKNEVELITRYREASLQPECESAIDDIVNEAIVDDGLEPIVQLNLDELNQTESFKGILRQEFQQVLDVLSFRDEAYEIFKRWYVDGRLFYHIVIDDKAPENGIEDVRYIDPRRIRKVREQKKKLNPNGVEVFERVDEYYIYNERGINNTQTTSVQGVKVAPDSICYVHSGLIENGRSNIILSWLHKALKFLNQLRHIEDAVVIYRLSRAPERRIFYIDVGGLPRNKAEQYMQDQIQKYRNKLVYDATTGEVRDDKRYLSMMEDFWLPRREGSKGTEITTLPGGENLGEISDIEYFEQKLYRALGVPISRLKSEGGFNLGRQAEISRDEEKFGKFVRRLKKRFSMLFDRLLYTQLILKGHIVKEDWEQIRIGIQYLWAENSYYAEIRESEALARRLELAMEVTQFMGLFYSRNWIRKNILRQNEEEMETLDKEMAEEAEMLPAMLATQMQAQNLIQNQETSLMQQNRFNNQVGGQ